MGRASVAMATVATWLAAAVTAAGCTNVTDTPSEPTTHEPGSRTPSGGEPSGTLGDDAASEQTPPRGDTMRSLPGLPEDAIEVPESDPTLVSTYQFRPQGYWHAVRYRPRQFATGTQVDPVEPGLTVDEAGAYAGWDLLNAPSGGVNRVQNGERWLTLELNRPARLAVVWRDGPERPRWLDAFAPGDPVTVGGREMPTFVTDAPAGEMTLGGVYDPGHEGPGRTPYLVLLAEADGRPSPDPAQPAGVPAARPNETCPPWVHDQYVAEGPDGQPYRTWHRPIDPVYWCYFHHEHGSDPAGFAGDVQPLFNYTAGHGERHEGFKVYVMPDGVGHDWMVTQHFGTSSITRACTRFHTTDVAIADRETGELIADWHLLGDYGPTLVNRGDDPLTPAACPSQAEDHHEEGTFGLKKMPAISRDAIGYEPWRMDSRNIVGFGAGAFTVNTHDGQTICNDLNCDSPVFTGNPGTNRTVGGSSRFAPGEHVGELYTNPLGTEILSAEDEGAVRQYVDPDAASFQFDAIPANDFNGHYADPWVARVEFIQNGDAILHEKGLRNLEDSLRIPN